MTNCMTNYMPDYVPYYMPNYTTNYTTNYDLPTFLSSGGDISVKVIPLLPPTLYRNWISPRENPSRYGNETPMS